MYELTLKKSGSVAGCRYTLLSHVEQKKKKFLGPFRLISSCSSQEPTPIDSWENLSGFQSCCSYVFQAPIPHKDLNLGRFIKSLTPISTAHIFSSEEFQDLLQKSLSKSWCFVRVSNLFRYPKQLLLVSLQHTTFKNRSQTHLKSDVPLSRDHLEIFLRIPGKFAAETTEKSCGDPLKCPSRTLNTLCSWRTPTSCYNGIKEGKLWKFTRQGKKFTFFEPSGGLCEDSLRPLTDFPHRRGGRESRE